MSCAEVCDVGLRSADIETDPRFLMHEAGLKKRWKYQVVTRMRAAHRQGAWRFPRSARFLSRYGCFNALLSRLWGVIWYAHIGASLLDPRFSVQYIGRYTKRAVLAEYRITFYDGRIVRFAFKDYAAGGRTSFATVTVKAFIGRLIGHIPGKYFPMVGYAGLFCNRWPQRYLTEVRAAMDRPTPTVPAAPTQDQWADRQEQLTGINPLRCPHCHVAMIVVVLAFGRWDTIDNRTQRNPRLLPVPAALRAPP